MSSVIIFFSLTVQINSICVHDSKNCIETAYQIFDAIPFVKLVEHLQMIVIKHFVNS